MCIICVCGAHLWCLYVFEYIYRMCDVCFCSVWCAMAAHEGWCVVTTYGSWCVVAHKRVGVW